MGIFGISDIFGYWVSTGRSPKLLYCYKCCEAKNMEYKDEADTLTRQDLEDPDKRYFCNLCGKEIKP
jgi:hypothetical protein